MNEQAVAILKQEAEKNKDRIEKIKGAMKQLATNMRLWDEELRDLEKEKESLEKGIWILEHPRCPFQVDIEAPQKEA